MTIYTDGASSLKRKIGCFGIYVPQTGYTLVKVVEDITNNFAELSAFICALKLGLQQTEEVIIVTDSLYVKNGYDSYMYKWNRLEKINGELWEMIYKLKEEKGAKFVVRHCRGHGKGKNDLPEDVVGNHIIDKLVAKAIQP